MQRAIMILFLLTFGGITANALQINVLTLSFIPMSQNTSVKSLGQDVTATISNLDFVGHFMQQLNLNAKVKNNNGEIGGLSHDVNQLFVENKAQLQGSIQGIGLATALQIRRLPAVVFNEHYIVYGTTDVLAAFNLYTLWLKENGDKK